MTTESRITDLLRMRAQLQRKVRPILDDLEAITNELEEAIAAVEQRRPVRKAIDIRTIDLHRSSCGE